MTTLKEKIIEAGFATNILTDVDLNNLLVGTPAARYGMVNKALNKNELIKIRRGLYVLSDKYRSNKLSKFFLASRITPHSYISCESALSYYGWIPERVSTITSVLAVGRTKTFATPFGEFDYSAISVNEYEFLTGVTRVEDMKSEPFLLATPLRALADLVYIKKIHWQGLKFLTDGMRIEPDQLMQITPNEFNLVKKVYRSKRVLHFLEKLEKELEK